AVLLEDDSRFLCIAMVIAMFAMIFIVKPSFDNPQLLGYSIALLGSFCASTAYTLVRKLSFTPIKGTAIVFYFSLFSCLAMIPSMIVDFHPMSIQQIIYLLMAGVMASV